MHQSQIFLLYAENKNAIKESNIGFSLKCHNPKKANMNIKLISLFTLTKGYKDLLIAW